MTRIPWHELRWAQAKVEDILGTAGHAESIADPRFPRPISPGEWLAADVMDFLDGRYEPRDERCIGPQVTDVSPHKGDTHLYRHFNAEGALLYVGISLSAIARLRQHRSNAHWSGDITRVEIETFAMRAEAELAEAKAIVEERPLHNIKGAPK